MKIQDNWRKIQRGRKYIKLIGIIELQTTAMNGIRDGYAFSEEDTGYSNTNLSLPLYFVE